MTSLRNSLITKAFGRDPGPPATLAQRFHTDSGQMTVRITAVGEGADRTLRVDGRLAGDDIAELIRACAGGRGPLVLELGGLQFADGRAVSVLRELRARGATLLGAPPYIRLLLGQPATADEAG